MKTDVVTPQDVFFHPVRMTVPLFQRPYVWSEATQWAPLWNDIVRLIDVIEDHHADATHFLGAIVIQSVPVRLGGLSTWNVIDGQQRLTTLQLLLDALHAQLEQRGLDDLAQQVGSLVANPQSFRKAAHDRYKLWPTNRDRDAFAAVMSAPTPVAYSALPASRLRDAHRYFSTAIGEWLEAGEVNDRAAVLVGAVTGRLEIASIQLGANEDAQAIFETLNARGTPLSAADLIKNYVFQQLDPADAEAAYLENWAEFETPWWEAEVRSGRVKNPRASLFLWQWLIARTRIDFPIREVFAQFKHYVTTVAKDVTELLPQLKASADRYRTIIEASENPNASLTRVQLFSYRVGVLDSEISRPLLIWLDEPEQLAISEADRTRILETLESWFVRRALVKAPSQGSNRLLVDLLHHLSAQPAEGVADALVAYLAGNHTDVGYWPGDAEVRAALTEANVYSGYRRGRVRMVLEALEDATRGYPGPNPLAMGPIVREKGTIEHLMPQKWREHWAADLTEEQELERDQRVQQLGNLTIVTQGLNSKVSNGPWEKKRGHFNDRDDVLLTRHAIRDLGEREWDEQAITSRTAGLIDQIVALWPAPAGHVGLEAPPAAPRSATYVYLSDLINAGWLEAGATLVSRMQAHQGVTGTLLPDGRISVDGVAYEYPTAAAKAVRRARTPVSGWWFWGVAGSEQRLIDVRADYLASLGSDDAADPEDAEAPEAAE